MNVCIHATVTIADNRWIVASGKIAARGLVLQLSQLL
jgi:hypothetical protein